MPLDPDSRDVMEMLKAARALPTAGTDAVAYRRESQSFALPPSTVTVDHVEDVTLDGPGGPLRLRLYRKGSGKAQGHPLLLFFHGGGFVGGSIETHDDMCRRLAQASDWMVGSLDYRLSPETRFPGSLDDCHAALDWARGAQGRAHGIDGSRIALIGDSAGGNLVAALALLTHARDEPMPVAQILLYPILDPRCEGASHRENATDYFLTAEACRWYWDQYAAPGADRDDPLIAPVRATHFSGLPPATIITAGFDPLRDEGARYAGQLRQAGVDTDYLCIDGTFHSFFSFGNLDATRQATERIVHRLPEK